MEQTCDAMFASEKRLGTTWTDLHQRERRNFEPEANEGLQSRLRKATTYFSDKIGQGLS